MLAFGAIVWALAPRLAGWAVLACALAVWLVVAVGLWAAFERLTYLAHQLKGSGGSYGFQSISTDAAELEKAIEKRAGGESARKLDEQIRQHVGNLRAEIERRSMELAPAS